jgi:hypothetical protein
MRHFKISSSNLFIISLALVAGIVLLLFVFQERISLPIPIAFNQITPTLAPAVPVPTRPERPLLEEFPIQDKSLPLTKTPFWDEMFYEDRNTTDDGRTVITRRARVLTEAPDDADSDLRAQWLDTNETVAISLDDISTLWIPLYTYGVDAKTVSSVELYKSEKSTLQLLTTGSMLVVRYYEDEYDAESQRLTPIEVVIATIQP